MEAWPQTSLIKLCCPGNPPPRRWSGFIQTSAISAYLHSLIICKAPTNTPFRSRSEPPTFSALSHPPMTPSQLSRGCLSRRLGQSSMHGWPMVNIYRTLTNLPHSDPIATNPRTCNSRALSLWKPASRHIGAPVRGSCGGRPLARLYMGIPA